MKFSSLGNDPDRFKALLGKVAMATIISIEFLPIAQKQGIKLMARGSEVMPKYLRLCTVTTGKTLEARREDAIRFLAAQMQGYQHSLTHKDELNPPDARDHQRQAGRSAPRVHLQRGRQSEDRHRPGHADRHGQAELAAGAAREPPAT